MSSQSLWDFLGEVPARALRVLLSEGGDGEPRVLLRERGELALLRERGEIVLLRERRGDLFLLRERRGDLVLLRERRGVLDLLRECRGDLVLLRERRDDLVLLRERRGEIVLLRERTGSEWVRECLSLLEVDLLREDLRERLLFFFLLPLFFNFLTSFSRLSNFWVNAVSNSVTSAMIVKTSCEHVFS